MEELREECNNIFKTLELEKTQKLNKCLDTAVYRGHAECVETLINSGADVKADSYLYAAADKGHEVCVKLMLNAGADVNASHEYTKDTALIRTATHGHSKCLELLIQAGADLDVQDHRE